MHRWDKRKLCPLGRTGPLECISKQHRLATIRTCVNNAFQVKPQVTMIGLRQSLNANRANLLWQAVAIISDLFTEHSNDRSRCSHMMYIPGNCEHLLPSHSKGLEGGDKPIARLLISTDVDTNVSVPFAISSIAKFHSPCALVLTDVTDLLQSYCEIDAVPAWHPTAASGSPMRDINVIFAESCSELDVLAKVLGKGTRKMFRPFILVMCNGVVFIFKRSEDGQNLETLSAEPTSGSHKNLARQFWPCLNGAQMLAITCATCSSAIEAYEQTGKWKVSFVGIVYEFSLKVNASLEMDEVLGSARDDPDEDGEWDNWFQPLVDGSAAMALIYRLTVAKSDLCHVTRPVAFGNCCFITAKPKRIEGSQDLTTLVSPLSVAVWLCITASLVFLFAMIAITIEFERWKRGFMSTEVPSRPCSVLPFHSILNSLLNPIVSQGASALFLRAAAINSESATSKEENILLRFLFATWLLVTIVLGCGYTSLMTSHVVLPAYSRPPKTFEELANSNYKISAVFWRDNFELDFQSLNLSFAEKIVARVQEFSPIDPAVITKSFAKLFSCIQVLKSNMSLFFQCYETIFEKGGGVCIAATKMIKYLGTKFTVNSAGEHLFVQSKETRFFLTVKLGVSHYYPALYGNYALDQIIHVNCKL